MDNIGIHTRPTNGEMEEQHRERYCKYIHQVLDKLVEYDLYLELDKCSFEKPEMNYLRVQIIPGEIHMEEDKFKKVKNWQAPTNVKEVQRFLGSTGYYWYFIYNYL